MKKLRWTLAQLQRLKGRYTRMRLQEHKQGTRQKIQLGDLIKKAGLTDEPTAVLLGLLFEASEILQSEEAEAARQRWKIRGDIAFTLDQSNAP